MKNNFNSTIAGATVLLAGVGIISRGLGFFREVAFASYYGLTTEFDLYLIGAVIPVTINTIILFIAQNIFVPLYHKYKNNDSSNYFLYQQLRIFLFISLLIFISLFVLSSVIITFYQPDIDLASKQIVNNIFRVSIISIPISSLNSICIVYLQAKYDFKNGAISQLFLNTVIIFAVVALSGTFSIYAVPLGYVVGTLLQSYYLVKKSKINLISIFKFSSLSKTLVLLPIKSLLIITAIESVGQLYVLLDRFFFSQVESGGIASISYAQNIFFLPMQIFSIALTTAIFPKLSELYSNKLFDKFESIINKSIHVIVIIFIPTSMVLFFWGNLIIKFFYERGKFLATDSSMTFQVLQMLTLSLFCYSIYAVLNKIFYTVNQNGLLLIITIGGIFIKIFFNAILVGPLSQSGLALSTTITYIYFFAASLFVLKMKKIYFPNLKLFMISLSTIINSAISLLIITIIFSGVYNHSTDISLVMLLTFVGLFTINLYLYDRDFFSRAIALK
ncbi:MAG TPA: hypothetical protein DHV28_18570 [Ignavibacteriales bacterium]|nr:hypothetical protein [Ignavibacteriales bacterium]